MDSRQDAQSQRNWAHREKRECWRGCRWRATQLRKALSSATCWYALRREARRPSRATSATNTSVLQQNHHHCNRNHKLEISTASTKAKSWELAYSEALIQNKIDRQWVRSRESGRQTGRWLWWMVFGVEMGKEVERRGWIIIIIITIVNNDQRKAAQLSTSHLSTETHPQHSLEGKDLPTKVRRTKPV